MSSESFKEDNGQGIFSFFPPPCDNCPWGVRGRCSGPRTVASQIERQGNLLSCFDMERTVALLQNLDEHRPLVHPRFHAIQGLPASIPVLCDGMPSELRLNSSDLYAIALDDLLKEDGSIAYSTAKELRNAFRLPPDGRVCLFASVRDTRLEQLWFRSDADLTWTRIRRLGFEFVTGATFSIFEQHSRNGQIFNADRNMLSVDLLAQEGIPVVPVFCETLEEDLTFAARWLEERPSLGVVAGLAQGWQTDKEFARFLWRMKFLKAQITRPLHFLVIGCSSAVRVWTLFQELGNVTVANTNLALRGVHGEGWDPEHLKMVKVPREIPRQSIVSESFKNFSEFCDTCVSQARKAA
jgi:hypothetical protein